MNKKTDVNSLKMPLLKGVVITRGRTVHTLPRGDYTIEKRYFGQVQKFFVDSAKFKGIKPPKNFVMSGATVFYEEKKIVDVYLAGWVAKTLVKGEIPRSVSRHGWGNYIDVELTSDFRLMLPPADRGRPFVTAIRLSDILILSWDVTTNSADHPPQPINADPRVIRLSEPAATTTALNPEVDRKRFETVIRYMKYIAEDVEEMKRLLIRLRDGAEEDDPRLHKAFHYALEHFLDQSIGDALSNRAYGRLSIKDLSRVELERELVSAMTKMMKDTFKIGRGRPRGSKTKKRTSGEEKSESSNKKMFEVKKKFLKLWSSRTRVSEGMI